MIYVLRQWKNGNVKGVCAHLARHRVPYRVIEAWETDLLPPLSPGDAILALGGPPSVCRFSQPDYDVHFLVREARYLAEARSMRIPVMGICLGHQLIGVMQGHAVATGELVVGIEPVETTLCGRDHWLFSGVPRRFWVYQHHRDAVQNVAPAFVLASSDTCSIESVAWDEWTVSTQFHPEVLGDEVETIVGKCVEQLDARGLTVQEVISRLPSDYETTTSRLFDNFLYRAGCIERPVWCERSWHFSTAVSAGPAESAA